MIWRITTGTRIISITVFQMAGEAGPIIFNIGYGRAVIMGIDPGTLRIEPLAGTMTGPAGWLLRTIHSTAQFMAMGALSAGSVDGIMMGGLIAAIRIDRSIIMAAVTGLDNIRSTVINSIGYCCTNGWIR